MSDQLNSLDHLCQLEEKNQSFQWLYQLLPSLARDGPISICFKLSISNEVIQD